jgi:tetratricopeptide (TPR) repeat protein
MILTSLIKNLLSGSKPNPVDELLGGIREALAADDLVTASSLIEIALAQDSEHGELVFYDGIVKFRKRNYTDALKSFSKAFEITPLNVDCEYHVALCQLQLHQTAAAKAGCYAVLAKNPNHVAAYNLLAGITLPGPNYMRTIAELHRIVRPSTYLEIGVATGKSIALAHASTLAIGVDPAPQIAVSLGSNVRLFPTSSDNFFASHDIAAELGNRPVDMAFIDGMHQFDFALRDFAAIERYCHSCSIILIHDCCPFDRKTATRERETTFWSGDVWKTILALNRDFPLELYPDG